MKRTTIVFLLLFVSVFVAFSQAVTVRVERIPSTIEAFVALRDKLALEPEGGAVMMIIAMMLYAENQELGLQAFTVALDQSELSRGTVYKEYQPKRVWNDKFSQIVKFPFLGRIYVGGTRSADGYRLPKGPYAFTFVEIRKLSEDSFKVFVESTGGNLPRPVTVIRNNRGIWKVKEASSLFIGPTELPPDNRKADDEL